MTVNIPAAMCPDELLCAPGEKVACRNATVIVNAQNEMSAWVDNSCYLSIYSPDGDDEIADVDKTGEVVSAPRAVASTRTERRATRRRLNILAAVIMTLSCAGVVLIGILLARSVLKIIV